MDRAASVWEVGGCWEMILGWGGWVVLISVPGEPGAGGAFPTVCVPSALQEQGA